jgi:DNA-directed RNA polymerase subunit RPC12/RpoP
MYDFKSLICYNCKSVILNLPKSEISKLNGLNFQCELCGHRNLLTEFTFSRSTEVNDPYINIQSVDSLLAL